MNIEIKTATIEPIRHTFDHVAQRIGGDKLASRYLEGTLLLQSENNFHYQPYWSPKFNLYDVRRTAVVMADWHGFRDPRQFYYANYTIARSKQQDAAERNFEFVQKRGLLRMAPAETIRKAIALLLPLRHYEWGANMNNSYAASFAYGSLIHVPTTFHAMDRLGLAQYLTQIGLILGDNDESVLERGRQAWIQDPAWQGLRRLTEDLFVTEDWFEVFLAQNLAADGLIHPLAFTRFPESQDEHGATLAVMSEFFVDWYGETAPWVDSIIKLAAAESADNRKLLSGWLAKWRDRVAAALPAVLEPAFGADNAAALLAQAVEALNNRARKLGLDA